MIFKIKVSILLIPTLFSGCMSVAINSESMSSHKTAQTISFNIENMYMNHIELEPKVFNQASKSIFKIFLHDHELEFVDDRTSKLDSLISTKPVTISFDELVKFGFVENDFSHGQLTAVGRSLKHPHTNKSITGIGFFLKGWDGNRWIDVESNRMYEQRAYNIINDVISNLDRSGSVGDPE